MQRRIVLVGAVAALTGCGQSGDKSAGTQSAKIAQPVKKPAFCFFKDEETKGWAASRDKDGNITVKGKAHVKDPRYKALFGPAKVEAAKVILSPTIGQNDTGYGAIEDWWDLDLTVPNSAAVGTVRIACGAKTLAELQVPLKGQPALPSPG